MPRLIVTAQASAGLTRCLRFLGRRDLEAARRAATAIDKHFDLLHDNPLIGRPVPERKNRRELVIPFGRASYVASYRIEVDAVYVIAFRHQREAGY